MDYVTMASFSLLTELLQLLLLNECYIIDRIGRRIS